MTEELTPDYLSLEDLLEIALGVIGDLQVRDIGLLASAAARPQSSAFGASAYPRLVDKAAALMHSLARNHPLVDGNKRLAWAATRSFLILNDSDIEYDVDEAESLVLGVASGQIDVPQIAEWLEQRLVND